MLSSKSNVYKKDNIKSVKAMKMKPVLSDQMLRGLKKLQEEKEREEDALKELQEQIRTEDETHHSKLETIEREAYEKGFRAGEEAGLGSAAETIDVLTGRLSTMIEELVTYKANYYKEQETEIVDIVSSVAERVVCAELETNRDVIYNVLNSAIEAIVETECLLVELNPSDLEHLRLHRPEFVEELQTTRGIKLRTNEELDRGGCNIENNKAEVHVNLKKSLKAIEKTMMESVGNEA